MTCGPRRDVSQAIGEGSKATPRTLFTLPYCSLPPAKASRTSVRRLVLRRLQQGG